MIAHTGRISRKFSAVTLGRYFPSYYYIGIALHFIQQVIAFLIDFRAVLLLPVVIPFVTSSEVFLMLLQNAVHIRWGQIATTVGGFQIQELAVLLILPVRRFFSI